MESSWKQLFVNMGYYSERNGLAARLLVAVWRPDAYVWTTPDYPDYWLVRWREEWGLPFFYGVKPKSGMNFPYGEGVEPD